MNIRASKVVTVTIELDKSEAQKLSRLVARGEVESRRSSYSDTDEIIEFGKQFREDVFEATHQ